MQTTFNMTTSIKYMQTQILGYTGLSKTAWQRKAIDYFLSGEKKISPSFKIKKRTDPHYISKPVTEQIYLDEEQKRAIEEVARKESCGLTTVLLQCMNDYCIYCIENDLVPQEAVKTLLESQS